MKRPNPYQPRLAVALEYDGIGAPRVTASGAGPLAEQIIELAREHGVALHQDKELTALLARVELDEEVPEALYRVVAQVIAFAYMLKGKFPAGYPH